MYWFLYDNGLRHETVNHPTRAFSLQSPGSELVNRGLNS